MLCAFLIVALSALVIAAFLAGVYIGCICAALYAVLNG